MCVCKRDTRVSKGTGQRERGEGREQLCGTDGFETRAQFVRFRMRRADLVELFPSHFQLFLGHSPFPHDRIKLVVPEGGKAEVLYVSVLRNRAHVTLSGGKGKDPQSSKREKKKKKLTQRQVRIPRASGGRSSRRD